MSTVENLPFRIVDEIPLRLHMWWSDLGEVGQRSVTKALGGLIGLLMIKPMVDLIEALIPFWDTTHNVFHFSDFELTPMLEEITGYDGYDRGLRHQYRVAPRAVTPQEVLELLSINRQVKKENLAEGYCTFHFLYSWKEKQVGVAQRFSLHSRILGTLIFPKEDGHIELGLVGVADFLDKKANGTLVPMIIKEIYRAQPLVDLKFFEGCNLLLQMWLVEHLCYRPRYMNYGLTRLSFIEEYENRVSGYELPEDAEAWFTRLCSLTINQIEWTFSWLSVKEVIYISTDVCFLLLMGLRSIQPYTPHRVLRQLGRYQMIPHDEDLST
ncbi:PREDICTED: uncharacterized protein LOC109243076 [Nicotiana attenuata]|uniref:uncharacterized protein LOC109243076 n=1 Tax=Nicotiana attenuata TaxID=49451 RepID=UPI0009054274|nr:PREDICTED: uncharacterized protein LOC109243076 [Nicotiana attenuata]